MKKILHNILLLAILLHPVCNPLAEADTFTVEGQCIVTKKGDLYIYLVDERTFQIPLTGIKKMTLKTGENKLKSTGIPFKFNDVSKGFYGIRCFQDLNSNKILDKGFLGPSEPWGMTWQRKKPAAWPVFKDIAFMVDSDIHNITIKVE